MTLYLLNRLYVKKLSENTKGKKMIIDTGVIFVVHTSGAEEKHPVHSIWALGCMGSVSVVPRL